MSTKSPKDTFFSCLSWTINATQLFSVLAGAGVGYPL